MGFFDSMMGKTPAPAPAPTPAPAAAETTAFTQEPVNPLDIYQGIFDKANSSEEVSPPFRIDDKVLSEVSSKLQFSSGINPELMQRATNGDPKAMIEMMDAVARNAYKAALSHTTALTDTHLNNRSEFERKTFGSKVKEQLIEGQITAEPSFKHPVVKAELGRIASALAKANPDASPEQIKNEAVRYLKEVQAAMNPNSQTQSKPQTAGEIDDWEAFLTS